MKEKYKLIQYLFSILLIVLFYHAYKNYNIINFIISLSIYIILSLSFSHINIDNLIKKYYENKYEYSIFQILKKSTTLIITINLIYLIFLLPFTFILENALSLSNLMPNIMLVSTFSFLPTLIRIINSVLIVYNLKKTKTIIKNTLLVTNIIFITIIVIIVNLLKIKENLLNILISSVFLLNFIIIILFYYFICYKKLFKNIIKKREENKINYKKQVITILKKDITFSLIKVIDFSFYYVSLIISYKVLLNRYNYSNLSASSIIINCYFYSLIIIYIIYKIIIYKNKQINKIITSTNEGDFKYLKANLSSSFLNIIEKTLPLCLILVATSNLIWSILFTEYNHGYIYTIMNIYLFFLILYNFLKTIILKLKKEKVIVAFLISLSALFLILIIPLIDSAYRMGYPLILGSILALILIKLLFIILSGIWLKKKLSISIIDNFEKFLNILYKNIILIIILFLINLIIPLEKENKLSSIIALICYFIILTIINLLVKNIKRLSCKSKFHFEELNSTKSGKNTTIVKKYSSIFLVFSVKYYQ